MILSFPPCSIYSSIRRWQPGTSNMTPNPVTLTLHPPRKKPVGGEDGNFQSPSPTCLAPTCLAPTCLLPLKTVHFLEKLERLQRVLSLSLNKPGRNVRTLSYRQNPDRLQLESRLVWFVCGPSLKREMASTSPCLQLRSAHAALETRASSACLFSECRPARGLFILIVGLGSGQAGTWRGGPDALETRKCASSLHPISTFQT